jgi:membrane protein DedA with SNARE-associated domain
MSTPMLTAEFTDMLGAAAGSKPLQAVTIIAGTFILEDAATLLAAMQVATGGVSLAVALGALYAGIVLGDLGLYGLGRLSLENRWARRLVPARRQELGREWASQRMIQIVLISRFVPGLRLPTYTTLGYLRAPLQKFAFAAILATLLWTSGLFYISLKLGVLLMRYLGIWRWAGLAVFCLLLILVGRFATRLYNNRNVPK